MTSCSKLVVGKWCRGDLSVERSLFIHARAEQTPENRAKELWRLSEALSTNISWICWIKHPPPRWQRECYLLFDRLFFTPENSGSSWEDVKYVLVVAGGDQSDLIQKSWWQIVWECLVVWLFDCLRGMQLEELWTLPPYHHVRNIIG